MSQTLTAIVLFGTFGTLLFCEVPIAVSLALSAILCLVIFDPVTPLTVIPHTILGAYDSFTLLAVPLFLVAGRLLGASGLSVRLIRFIDLLIRNVRGGMGIVAVVASLLFAGISGSGPADVAALGMLLYPPLVASGYTNSTAAALLAVGGGIGIIVPPSIALILYGVVAEVSVNKLFFAGILPGILVSGVLIIVVMFCAPARAGRKETTARELVQAGVGALGGLMAPLIILGGIYRGIFTATESAAAVVMYILLLEWVWYREMKWRELGRAFYDAAKTSAQVLFLVACASLFSFVLHSSGLTQSLVDLTLSISGNRYAILLLVNAVLLIAGCFIDAISLIYIFVPIFLPVIRSLGIDPVHFGVMVVVNLAIGQSTPPVGVNLFVASSVCGVPVASVSWAVVKFIVAEFLALVVLVVFPQISLLLPQILA